MAAAQATGAGGDGDDISATRALGACRGDWPGKSAGHGDRHGEPAPLRPGPRPRRPRAPQAAPHPTAPHSRIPAPRGHLPGLAEGRAGARGPHKLLTPGAEGGRRRARSLDGWGERAGADAGRASRPLGARSPGSPQRLLPAPSARPGASSRGASIAGPRGLPPSSRSPVSAGPSSPGAATRAPIFGESPSLSLPRPPAAHGARPG